MIPIAAAWQSAQAAAFLCYILQVIPVSSQMKGAFEPFKVDTPVLTHDDQKQERAFHYVYPY
ncbi:hypothetical protein IV04_14285 [Serratia sp. Ag1]|nr:hypothetical protein JV45_01800 [Serratia sp. Ag2]KFK98061.1 hypothetical protein IV04_14285 [Serratia sp. Ag1]